MMLAGDIGFAVMPPRIGAAVRAGLWFLNDDCRFSHVFMPLGDGTLIEAMPRGARIAPMGPDRFTAGHAYVRPHMTDDERRQVLRRAWEYEGTRYGFTTYGYLLLHRLGANPQWLRDAISDAGTMICSQLVDAILTRVGFHIFDDGRLSQDVTPGSLYYATDPRVIYTPSVRTSATR